MSRLWLAALLGGFRVPAGRDPIGIKQPDNDLIPLEVRNAAWPPFEKAMLVVAAQIHFFHELDDDLARSMHGESTSL